MSAAFTLVEVLAAMFFLAILIPTVLNALTLSNRASVIAERTDIAAQLAENKLNELLIDTTTNSSSGDTRGDFGDDWPGYRWELTRTNWDSSSSMTELDISVYFTVQGREHSVRLSTLASQTTSQ
jgi:type II secretory pathway pseudopilin PulG